MKIANKMRKVILVIVLFLPSAILADIIELKDGRMVNLGSDGTYEFLESEAEIQYKQLLAKEALEEQVTALSLVINDQLAVLKSLYVSNIAAKVKSVWRYQSAEDDWSAEVYVVQDRDGNVKAVEVKNANVSNSSLAKSFMDSIERAVNKASPLPGAPDDAVFDSQLYMLFSVK